MEFFLQRWIYIAWVSIIKNFPAGELVRRFSAIVYAAGKTDKEPAMSVRRAGTRGIRAMKSTKLLWGAAMRRSGKERKL